MTAEDTGHVPTDLLVVALCIVAVLSSFLLFLDYIIGEHENISTLVPLIFTTIISIVSLAYAVKANNELAKVKDVVEKNIAEGVKFVRR